MNAFLLQFPNRERDDLALGAGVHVLARDDNGLPELVDDAGRGMAQLSIDPRGIWLQVRDDVRGVHVNGRPVRHMAMLRMGDTLHVDGYELTLLGPALPPVPETPEPGAGAPVVLRGIGGAHHGRSLVIERAVLVGRDKSCEVCIDAPDFAGRHARLEPHHDGLVLRDLGSESGSRVNGWPVRHALLAPGAQVVFGTRHRFVVEAATMPSASALVLSADADNGDGTGLPLSDAEATASRPLLRIPWLLLAALLLAGALSLLLLYGVR